MWALLLCLFVVNAVFAAAPPVKVSLRTSWPAVPILVEAIEAVCSESSDAFFPLLDALTDPETSPNIVTLTPEATLQRTLQTAISLGFLDDPAKLASAELQLVLHTTSPKIQAFYQFYEDQHFPSVEDCESWVDWYGERVCDLETLVRLAGHETLDESSSAARPYHRPKLLPFDHINPSSSKTLDPPPRTAIYYASPTSRNFRELHTFLLKLSSAREPRVEYLYRHVPPIGRKSTLRNILAGYGVALDLKKTDYLAVDDRRSGRMESWDDAVTEDNSSGSEEYILSLLDTLPQNIRAVSTTLGLTKTELLHIDMQATHLIANSTSPLRTLTELVQNFPKYATAIARRFTIPEDVEEEIQLNQLKAQGGVSTMWLNGGSIPANEVSALSILRYMRQERAIVDSLTSLGLNSTQAVSLLTSKIIADAQSEGAGGLSVSDGLVDASDRPEGGDLILWWNDLTKDSRYSKWSSAITQLLRPLYPGQFPNVKLNIFNIVLVLDLSQTSSLNLLAGSVSNIINRGYPLRFAFVPSLETEEGTQMARLLYYLVRYFGRAKTMGFLSRISQMHTPVHLMTPSVDLSLVRSEFATLIGNFPPTEEENVPMNLDEILDGTAFSVDERFEKAREYASRLDATVASNPTGHAFVNGKHIDVDNEFLKYMQMEISAQMQYLQEKLYGGELTQEVTDHIDTYFYDLPDTSLRRSRYIYPAPTIGSLRVHNLRGLFARGGLEYSKKAYLYPDTEILPLTTYVVADLDSADGISLITEAVSSLKSNSTSRLSFIHNPATGDADIAPSHRRISPILSYLVSNQLLSEISASDFEVHLDYHSAPVEVTPAQTVLSGNSAVYQLLRDAVVSIETLSESEAYVEFTRAGRLIARELGLAPGELALVVNGRAVGPVSPGSFRAGDFGVLGSYEMRKRVAPVVEALTNLTIITNDTERQSYSELVSMASSVLSAVQIPDPSAQGLFNAAPRPRTRNYQQLSRNLTGFAFGDSDKALYHFGVLLDPLSDIAQKWGPILEWLSTIPSVFVEVYLNPTPLQEAPLKRYYRYNLPAALSFDENGNEVHAQTVFEGLPIEPIYTLAMDVPPSWLVRPREALHDLDNIQLSSLSNDERDRGVEAVFDLDYLVIEGHARDAVTTQPPRGLQLQLSAIDGSPVDDTQVVANLGYLQFKAKPGVFQLEIREGRGRDVYVMESVGNEGWNSKNVSEVGVEVTLTSFEGLTLYPRVRRRPGMERADVLDQFVVVEKEPKGLLEEITSRVVSFFRPSSAQTKAIGPRQADINIFTVASGLLYERFASIMILSVLKNTNSTVKFWFIENFLSPSFLEFIPHFAQQYGFEYELVTYKWPSWLRAQKEKQRIIWAYKILFLDVLFPMDLKKVIFVDADQIVRTDLKELIDLDLHGAPYGYTPMGDDNTEMEGFRFWKTGYWRDFLQGRPYHISALYVVDLARFRQVAAGDILRQHYQQLSADPASLANLDQDLPNNLQREVPIFSLPEDWLWCETWCSKDRLHRAKTIDLCQNPLTKEPKLSRARQIPEWEAYDAEIARVAQALVDAGTLRSHVAATGVDALAGAAGGPAPGAAPSVDEDRAEADTDTGAGGRSADADTDEDEDADVDVLEPQTRTKDEL